ncbi:UDP-N-acetylmuramate--L-alanine ligase [Psychromicrobium lacuslunae]|uniref:UDP-N-acetylmuramate--L-alanine ligase n=1 Tax=Psychromicrobium lacuslunae TaxID=1618207 RepID=UPI0005D4540C|nr:UDP-N-acetylmuramate--L-alanine ligase [Psychromicrobium lacuslunae]
MSPEVDLELSDLGTVHFIGIGGAGMSGIARIMLADGVVVSGSDAKASAALTELSQLGARTFIGHAAEQVSAANTVVVSSAIKPSNPELLAAQQLGLRILHRSEALAATMKRHTVVAVAGTHGKTTTSSMIAVALRRAGLDPSFAIGATVVDLGANAYHGRGDIFVAEADESDGSFLNYRPKIAVLTNAEPDHLDHYGSAEAVMRAFGDFIALLPEDGLLVACADDEGSLALSDAAVAAGHRVLRYGRNERADLRLRGSALEFRGRQYQLELAVPGEHNRLNAAAAFAVGIELGGETEHETEQLLAALAEFRGAARRFELKGSVDGVRVFDDYAHHPTELKAALQAARTVAAGHRVLVLFQPHLFSRTREFATEFAAALELADAAAVLDIYPAREEPILGVSSALITDLAAHTEHFADPQQALASLLDQVSAGDLILTIGAGDVTQWGPVLLEQLNARTAGPGERGSNADEA